MADLPKLKDGDVINSTQEKEIKRLTFNLLMHQIFTFFNFEKGYLNSIYLLVKSPGEHIRSYLSIERERLINPFKFYFLGASIYAFVFLKLYTIINKEKIEPASVNDSEFKIIFIDNLHVWFLILVVFITIYSYLFFKNKSGYNLVENLIFNMYIMGLILLVSAILSPLEFISEYYQIIVNMILIFYFSFAYVSFFGGNYVKTIFLSLTCFILGLITLAITIVFVGFIYGFVQAL